MAQPSPTAASQAQNAVQPLPGSAGPVALARVCLKEPVTNWGPEALRILTSQHGTLSLDISSRLIRAVPSQLSGRAHRPTLLVPLENVCYVVELSDVPAPAPKPVPPPAPKPVAKNDTVRL